MNNVIRLEGSTSWEMLYGFFNVSGVTTVDGLIYRAKSMGIGWRITWSYPVNGTWWNVG